MEAPELCMGMALVLRAWIEMTDSRRVIPGTLILSLILILWIEVAPAPMSSTKVEDCPGSDFVDAQNIDLMHCRR